MTQNTEMSSKNSIVYIIYPFFAESNRDAPIPSFLGPTVGLGPSYAGEKKDFPIDFRAIVP